MKKENIVEVLISILVIATIIAVPFAIFALKISYTYSTIPEEARVVNLTAIAKGGIWTQEQVAGYNYWWKKFRRAEEIPVKLGEKILFRVTSSDVLHTFAIPRFRIGPEEVYPGKLTKVEFEAEREGTFKYLCWLWCDDDHPNMHGNIVVSQGEKPDEQE